ncbi:MAG: siroheme decarboxylase subunit alpha [Desulfohalobiaceae bacterium]
MDTTDKRILDVIQSDFPLVSRPYAEIGSRLGLTEEDVLRRVRSMRENDVIRRIGANFHSRMLGWKSTLCAASVPEERLDEFVSLVNTYPGVTHNYLRKHSYNVWFTYIGPSWEEIERDLEEISRRTGIKVLNLPAQRMFKIKVDFPMNNEADSQSDSTNSFQ